jgi:hypothetical protein
MSIILSIAVRQSNTVEAKPPMSRTQRLMADLEASRARHVRDQHHKEYSCQCATLREQLGGTPVRAHIRRLQVA